MTSYISHTSIDCHNAYELSEWWKHVLEYVDKPDDPNEPGHEECWIERPDGGHPRAVHRGARREVDQEPDPLRPASRAPAPATRSSTASSGLGATQVDDQRNDDGTGWVVLADPEGNEFCILRSMDEVVAGPID